MKRNDFPTLWFPPLTYYKEEGKIDFEKMEQELAKIYPYSQGVLIPGSTGDAWVLDDARQEEIVRFFLKGFSFGRFAVMLGALKPTVEETLASIARWCDVLCDMAGTKDSKAAMESLGVKAFVFCVPNGMTDPAEQKAAMSRILANDLPMAFYQLPGVTGVTVEPALISELADEFDKLTLLRGAEGDPAELVLGDNACYDGLLLSTVNCFAAEYDAFLKEEKTYAGFGDVITDVFAEAAVTTFAGKIVAINPDGTYLVLVTNPGDAAFVYTKPMGPYSEPSLRSETLFYNKAGEVARVYGLHKNDRISVSAEGFSGGTPAVGKTISSVANKKLVIA